MNGRFLEGVYDEDGRRILPPHECTPPEPAMSYLEGMVWVCDCGSAWRVQRSPLLWREWCRFPRLDDGNHKGLRYCNRGPCCLMDGHKGACKQ